ncbi:MAG: TIGR03016 family PEP-CTERM system-associated outer membrane protein [Gammaproteobacteria bacterium]|nr:TIGR03016 family PEP-CTERM system-associated outer membrane protein [Gammaproteobacteria bacterium]
MNEQNSIKIRRLNTLIATLLLCFSLPANAETRRDPNLFKNKQQQALAARHWTIEPRLSIEGSYSDNIALAIPGDEESDFISEVNPALEAKLKGNRVKGELAYRMQNLFYAENRDSNNTFHQYNLLGNAELWREKFFLDANSTLRQRNISSQQFVTGNRNLDTNRTDQLTASVRPYFKQALGSLAETLVQYEYGIVDFEDDKVVGTTSDSRLNDVLVAIASPTKDKDRLLSWSLRYAYQDIDYDSAEFDDLNFERVALELIYPVSSELGLIAEGGYEDNDLGEDAFANSDTKGTLWQAGFRWRPNTKTQVEARLGDRFFGNAGLLRWQQRGLRITTELRYTKDIGGYTGFALQDTGPIDPSSQFSANALGLTARAFIRKRLDAVASFNTIKSQITLLVFDEERDFRTANSSTERWTGIRPSWKWRFAPRTTLTTSLQWGRLKPSGVQRKDYPLVGNISLKREIGQRTQANLTYRHARVESDDPLVEYRENTLTLSLIQSF